ncbi:MAG: inositol monophosphatase family protein, partial [Actinomycetales bacterium]
MILADLLALHPLAPLAWQAGTQAGDLLRDGRPVTLDVMTKSTPTDVVTEMDRRSEQLIVDLITSQRPQDAILGEEGGERPGTSGVRWVVDPLDATVNYLYRLPLWGVSVAAEVDGQVEVGVVIAPDLQDGYLGIRGQGSWRLMGERAVANQVSSCQELSQALVTTGFGYSPQQRARHAHVVNSLLPDVRDIRRTGCAVVDFCWLASGRLDA